MMRNWPIQRKLHGIIALITILVLLVALTIMIIFSWIDDKRNLYFELEALAEVIADNNSANIVFNATQEATISLSSLKAKKNIVAAQIHSSVAQNELAYYYRDSLKNSDQSIVYKSKHEMDYFDLDKMEIFKPVVLENETIGWVYIRSDLNNLLHGIKQFLLLGLGVLILSMLIALILTRILQKTISEPIIGLTSATSKISDTEDYSVRVQKISNDELGSLTESFNSMLSRIESQNKALTKAKNLAEASEKTKELFLANISHELRTPLNAVVGLSDLIQEKKYPKELHEYIGGISASSKQLQALVNDILDLSKIQSGKLKFEVISFSLKELFEEISYTCNYHAKQKNISLSFDIDQNIPLLMGDPTRLKQILLNLLSNAIKFTDQGRVHFSVRCMDIKSKKARLIFKVEDTGIGIPPEKKEAIFENFTQADSSTTRLYGGTGLGLSICKHIVDLQNGKIWLESTINKGSQFFVELQYAISENTANKNTIKDLYFKNLNVLCVDDYPLNLTILSKMLEKSGIRTILAKNGLEAIDELKKHQIDIIFMDIQMPVLDGLGATKQIRALKDQIKNKVPIIALTANARESQKKEFTLAGMNGYLTKPYNRTEILTFLGGLFKDKLSHQAPIVKESEPVKNSDDSLTLDLSALTEMFGEDKALLRELIEQYKKEFEVQLHELDDIHKKEKYDQLSDMVHKVKPAVTYLKLTPLLNLFINREDAIKNQVFSAPDFCTQFQTLLKQSVAKIETYLQTT